MSLSAPKKYIKNNNSKTVRTYRKKNEKLLCIEECKRLYQKYYSYPSSNLLKQLNENYLKIYIENLKFKDISVISELLSKYFYFQQIELSLNDPNKVEQKPKRKIYRPIILSKEEKEKIEKEKKIREKDIKNMINKIIISISNFLSSSKSIISLSINNIELTEKYCDYLSKGIMQNKSLQSIGITNCKILLNPYELLLESLLNHNLLCYLDLSNNNLSDKYEKIISRIIIRQTQRRDQVIWSYGLRNEVPLTNDYKKGLIFLNLNGNNLSKDSADSITNALYSDQYIRAIYLNNNNFDNNSCKKFIYMMRKNLSILTIDLRSNPGYDNYINSRLVLKMSKNIRFLYQQYKKGEYSEEEFENFKIFIDVTFFDVDIPQNVVDFYNSNLPENYEENENKISNENINTEIEGRKLITEIKNEKLNNIDNENKDDDNENGMNIKNENIMSKSVDILKENKKLQNENIRLKQQIIELKAKKLQNYLNGGDKINNKNNESNESNIENDYQKVELLIKELNDLMNKIEIKKSKQKKKIKKKINQENNNKNENKQINNTNNINNNINNINNNIIKKEENNNVKIKEIISEETNEINKNIVDNNNIKINIEEDQKEIDNKINNEKEKEKEKEDIKENEKEDIKINNINMINKEEIKNNEKEIKNELDILHQNDEQEDEKDKESNDSHFVDENGNVYNFDDLTEEEKMLILQQQLIIQRLQEEAEARGEQFDPQEYIEFLERQAKEEEDEEEITGQSTNQINKSF